MTDIELLAKAANAAGYQIQWLPVDAMPDQPFYEGRLWNPLLDDGAALRLASDMGMNLFMGYGRLECAEVPSDSDEPPISVTEDCPHAYLAIRRAIVRAAAEIGRSMP